MPRRRASYCPCAWQAEIQRLAPSPRGRSIRAIQQAEAEAETEAELDLEAEAEIGSIWTDKPASALPPEPEVAAPDLYGLPREVVSAVLSFLPAVALCRLSRVSKQLCEDVRREEQALFRELLRRDFAVSHAEGEQVMPKQVYRRCALFEWAGEWDCEATMAGRTVQYSVLLEGTRARRGPAAAGSRSYDAEEVSGPGVFPPQAQFTQSIPFTFRATMRRRDGLRTVGSIDWEQHGQSHFVIVVDVGGAGGERVCGEYSPRVLNTGGP